eukprot:Lithocolla_globosa_v1_NODE_4646_length_1394_cov_3532.837939.p2 type:complete len:143 gc:universal NODE_4646_length_1394_cov_3532.837939:947-1375(+)
MKNFACQVISSPSPFLSFPFLSFPFLSFPFLSFPLLPNIFLSSAYCLIIFADSESPYKGEQSCKKTFLFEAFVVAEIFQRVRFLTFQKKKSSTTIFHFSWQKEFPGGDEIARTQLSGPNKSSPTQHAEKASKKKIIRRIKYF